MFTSGFTLREKIKSDFISARIFSKLKGVLIKRVKKEEDGQYLISKSVKEYATTPFSFFENSITRKSSDLVRDQACTSNPISTSNKNINSYCSPSKPKKKGFKVFTSGLTLREKIKSDFISARIFSKLKGVLIKGVKKEEDGQYSISKSVKEYATTPFSFFKILISKNLLSLEVITPVLQIQEAHEIKK